MSDNLWREDNTGYSTPDLTHMLESEVLEILGASHYVACNGQQLDPSMPQEILQSTVWANWEAEYYEDIRLIGFGSARPVTACLSSYPSSQLRDQQTPEAYFIGKIDHRADLFRIGCVVC